MDEDASFLQLMIIEKMGRPAEHAVAAPMDLDFGEGVDGLG